MSPTVGPPPRRAAAHAGDEGEEAPGRHVVDAAQLMASAPTSRLLDAPVGEDPHEHGERRDGHGEAQEQGEEREGHVARGQARVEPERQDRPQRRRPWSCWRPRSWPPMGERCRMRSVSSSMPTRKMKRITPIWASTPRAGRISGRKTYDGASGARGRAGRAEQDAGDHLPDHRRLAQPPKSAPTARAVRITTTSASSTGANGSAAPPACGPCARPAPRRDEPRAQPVHDEEDRERRGDHEAAREQGA